MLGIVGRVVYDEFLSVKLPRTLTLQNRRLGMLLKMLQILFFILAVLYCLKQGLWRNDMDTEPWLLAISQMSMGYHSRTKHCAVPRELNSTTSKTCRPMREHTAHAWTTEVAFFPTAIWESDRWEGNGDACTAHATKQWCQGSVPAGIFQNDEGQCSCQTSESFYVQNPEHERFSFFHGYRADVRTLFGSHSVLASSALTADLRISGQALAEEPGELSTVFLTPTGSKCVIGDRSEWSRVDASNGISGTLEELLTCAGVNLDTNPKQLIGGLSFQAWETVRAMGLSLELSLNYQRTGFFDDRPHTCYVTVLPAPSLSSMNSSGLDGATEWTQTVRGVTVTAKLRYSYRAFDLGITVGNLVNVLVILKLPLAIVQFLALYCLGIVSRIYRGMHSAKINIFSQLHGYVSRHLLAVVGFRGLIGKWEGSVSSLPDLTKNQLQHYLEDVFGEECDKHVLEPEDLRRMVNSVFDQLDTDNSGGIGFREFVHACNKQDDCELETLAHFFRRQEPNGSHRFRRLFDSTHKRLEVSVYNRWSHPSRSISKWSSRQEPLKTNIAEVQPPPEPTLQCMLVALEEQHLALAAEVNQRLSAMEVHVCELHAKLLGESEPRTAAEVTLQGELANDVTELQAAAIGLAVPEAMQPEVHALLEVCKQPEHKMQPNGTASERQMDSIKHALREEAMIVAPTAVEVVAEDAGQVQAGEETNVDASCPSVILPQVTRASPHRAGPVPLHTADSLQFAVRKFSSSLIHPSDLAAEQKSGRSFERPAISTRERYGTGNELVDPSKVTPKCVWPLTVEDRDVMEPFSVDRTTRVCGI